MPEGRIMINKEEVPAEQFGGRVHELLKGNTSKMVFFSGARENDYETTMRFLDIARTAGAKNIGIIVEDVASQ
jgi:biopolymer transport protein ExbD